MEKKLVHLNSKISSNHLPDWISYSFTFCFFEFLVQEGAFLYEKGINPYSGDLYHENPLILYFSNFLLRNVNSFIPYIFIGCDLLCAYLLMRMSQIFIAQTVSILTLLIYHCFNQIIINLFFFHILHSTV